jgi:hypothetical protein
MSHLLQEYMSKVKKEHKNLNLNKNVNFFLSNVYFCLNYDYVFILFLISKLDYFE